MFLSKQGEKVAVLERNKDFNNKNGGVILQSKTLGLFDQLGGTIHAPQFKRF
ncbi:hypothetical protein [Bacillus pseudomycoides]|uniref:hypothetical protein n=1 Tax=Bacillus pseudomycoides TaxID=64104 RepID=UPI0037BEAF2D